MRAHPIMIIITRYPSIDDLAIAYNNLQLEEEGPGKFGARKSRGRDSDIDRVKVLLIPPARPFAHFLHDSLRGSLDESTGGFRITHPITHSLTHSLTHS